MKYKFFRHWKKKIILEIYTSNEQYKEAGNSAKNNSDHCVDVGTMMAQLWQHFRH